MLRQPLGECCLVRVEVQVAAVRQAAHLLAHGGHLFRVTVAQYARRDAGRKVEVLAAGGVIQQDAAAMAHRQRVARARAHHVCAVVLVHRLVSGTNASCCRSDRSRRGFGEG